MLHKLLNDIRWIFNNVNVSPIDPFMLWLQCCIQKIVPRTANDPPPRSLGTEAVTIFNPVVKICTEIFQDDLCSPKLGRIRVFL